VANDPPIIDSVSFDKSSYSSGDTVTMTVKYHAVDYQGGGGNPETYTVYVDATDEVNGLPGNGSGTFTVEPAPATPDPVDVSVPGDTRPSGAQPWTLVSDDHVGTAVFTTVA